MAPSKVATMREEHLRKAARSLAVSSPAVSSYLGTVMAQNSALGDSKNMLSCSGCGAILLSGYNCERRISSTRGHCKRTRQDRLNKPPGVKRMLLECSRCQTLTAVEMAKSSPDTLSRPSSKSIPVAANVTARQCEPASAAIIAPPNATSEPSGVKKRGRGKKSTLQSMLTDSKSAKPAKGFGLALNDFMKP